MNKNYYTGFLIGITTRMVLMAMITILLYTCI